MYIDKLTNDDGAIAYHYRMKGVDLKCVELVSQQRFGGELMDLYRYLLDPTHALTFDLTKTKPRFKMDKNFTVSTITNFSRTLSFGAK